MIKACKGAYKDRQVAVKRQAKGCKKTGKGVRITLGKGCRKYRQWGVKRQHLYCIVVVVGDGKTCRGVKRKGNG